MIHIKKYFKNKKKENLDAIDNCKLSESDKNDIIEKLININLNNEKLSNEFLYDLELLKGNYNKYEESIIYKIDKTHTNIGNICLKNIILNPLDNIEKLTERQNIIKKITEFQDFDKIDGYLKILKENENNLLWLWKENDKEVNQYLDSVYFQNRFFKIFNQNENMLNAFNYYKIVIAPLLGVLYPVVAILLPFLIVRFAFKIKISFSNYYKLISSSIGGSLFPSASNSGLFKLSKMFSSFLYFFFYLHNTYFSITYSLNTNRIINIIHKKMNSIYNYIKTTNKINELLKNIIPNQNLKLVGKYIDSEIFNTEPSFFSNKGIILSEYKYITENKDLIIPIIEYSGLIDSYFSISKLYKENKDSNFYSFSNYNISDNPFIDIKGNWHPYLNKKEVIKNDIVIGNGNPQNIVITGPNAGGKSTFIKSLILSVLFSQTLTIAPCENINFTPFNFLSTYLNIPDCKGKESLFEAEMNRSLNYINKLRNMEKQKKFSIVIMDEIFNSTNPKEGISGAFAICKKISTFKNSLSVITTHFNYLTKLDEYGFENYKIPIKKEEDKIIYTYKLKKGISNQFIALDLLKEKGFDNEIIQESRNIYKKLNKVKKKKNINKNKKEKNINKNKKEKTIQNIIEL